MSCRDHRIATAAALLIALAGVPGCGQVVTGTASASGGAGASVSSDAPAAPVVPGPPRAPGAPGALAAGPITVVGVGDSLTQAVGDESGKGGFVGVLTEAIAAEPGREGSTLVNLGQSGWDSTMVVTGGDGSPAELGQAVEAVRAAGGAAVLATVLIGSNDLWYTYQNGAQNPTSTAEEDTAVATYRTNLERMIRELKDAGAVVIVGLPDDQSLRPVAKDIVVLNQSLSEVTEEEVGRMSQLSKVLARTVQEVAAAQGVAVVDTNGPFWADPATMDPDGIHPNAAGYAIMAAPWIKAVEPLL